MPIRPIISGRSILFLAEGTVLVIISALALWLIDPSYKIIDEETFEGVVFFGRRSAELLGFMVSNERSAESYWTPDKRQILVVEDRLVTRVKEQLPALVSWLDRYKRQYFGFMRDGQQYIMIVGFCEQSKKDWHRELITLPDAAECYFEAQFDVAKEAFLYLWQVTE